MGVDHTFESKVMAIWTFRELPLLKFDRLVNSWASIIHSSQKLWPFEFLRASVVQFWASRYIMGIDHTFESKVMAIWTSKSFRCSILSVSIYHGRRSYIRVNSYGHLNFPRDFLAQFWPSHYIIGVDHTIESKVIAIWISQSFRCSILSVSIYHGRRSYIHVKSYGHLNFPRASIVKIWLSR